jgi:hypothetical protein
MPSAKDPRVTSTDGHAPDAEGAAPGPVNPATGQHTSYWVLNEEERKKGFVRPVRRSYKHVGIKPTHPTKPLTEEQAKRNEGQGYVAYEEYPPGDRAVVGRFWTAPQLESGCGGVTTMSVEIAETYARQPDFYGATFCVDCRRHIPVAEFVWMDDGKETAERLGT